MRVDANDVPIQVGFTVRMNETITNHDVVKGVDYEVVQAEPTLTIRHPVTGETFGNRASYRFYITGQGTGPW